MTRRRLAPLLAVCLALAAPAARAQAAPDDARAAHAQALSLRAAGRLREAREAARRCVAAARAPDDATVLAAASALLDELAHELALLTLALSPVDAAVTVDGAPVPGVGAERVLELDPGPHTLRVTSRLAAPRELALTLARGARERREVTLESLPGSITVETLPAGAEVRVDDAALGPSPAVWRGPSGAHAVRATLAGWEDAARAVVVAPGERVTLRLALAEARRPVTSSPWFWVGIGGAALAVGAAVVVALAPWE